MRCLYCDALRWHRGLCAKHYKRAARAGRLDEYALPRGKRGKDTRPRAKPMHKEDHMQPVWSPEEFAAVGQQELTQTHRAIGESYGLSRFAIASRLQRWRRREGCQKPRESCLMTPPAIARALGCPYYTIRKWQKSGKLQFLHRSIGGYPACTMREISVFLEQGYALCLSIQPPATALYWRHEVACIRRNLKQRLVDQRLVYGALGVTVAALSDWRVYGFPFPVVNLGMYGVWLERHAVIAWLNQWPTKYTKAARRLLEGTQ